MISGCTDKNVHTTGLSDHLLFDHYPQLKRGRLACPYAIRITGCPLGHAIQKKASSQYERTLDAIALTPQCPQTCQIRPSVLYSLHLGCESFCALANATNSVLSTYSCPPLARKQTKADNADIFPGRLAKSRSGALRARAAVADPTIPFEDLLADLSSIGAPIRPHPNLGISSSCQLQLRPTCQRNGSCYHRPKISDATSVRKTPVASVWQKWRPPQCDKVCNWRLGRPSPDFASLFLGLLLGSRILFRPVVTMRRTVLAKPGAGKHKVAPIRLRARWEQLDKSVFCD